MKIIYSRASVAYNKIIVKIIVIIVKIKPKMFIKYSQSPILLFFIRIISWFLCAILCTHHVEVCQKINDLEYILEMNRNQ